MPSINNFKTEMLDFVVLLENDAFGFLEKGEAEAEQHDNNE